MNTYRSIVLSTAVALMSGSLLLAQPIKPGADGTDPATPPAVQPGPKPGPRFIGPPVLRVPPGGVDVAPGTDLPADQPKADPKPDQAKLVAAARQGPMVFTATVVSVQMLARTNSIPPSVMMQVVFKDLTMLKNEKPAVVRFNYTARQGQGYVPAANQKVIVVASVPVAAPPAPAAPPDDNADPGEAPRPHNMLKPRMGPVTAMLPTILVMADATDENLAAVKAVLPALAEGAKQPMSQPEGAADAIEPVVKESQLVFTATVEQAQKLPVMGQAPVTMTVTIKDPEMIKGPSLKDVGLAPPLTFQCLVFMLTKFEGFVPVKDQKVLVVGNAGLAGPIVGGPPTQVGGGAKVGTKLNVTLLVPATDANVARAKKIAGPNTPEGKLEAAVRSGELVFTATIGKLVMFGAVQPPIQQVSVKDVVMLKGWLEKPTTVDCRYPRTADLPFNPALGQKVLIAANPQPKDAPPPGPGDVSGRHTGPLPVPGGNGPEVFFMVEATDENVVLAERAITPASAPSGPAPVRRMGPPVPAPGIHSGGIQQGEGPAMPADPGPAAGVGESQPGVVVAQPPVAPADAPAGGLPPGQPIRVGGGIVVGGGGGMVVRPIAPVGPGGAAGLRIQPMPPVRADDDAAAEMPATQPADPKARLVNAVNQGALVLTGTVVNVAVSPIQPMIYPPITSMTVILKDAQMLKGEKPQVLTFAYSAAQGRDLTPKADQKVLVVSGPVPAANVQPGEDVPVRAPPAGPGMMRPHHVILGRIDLPTPRVLLMVEATDENIALAKKAIANPTSAPDTAKTPNVGGAGKAPAGAWTALFANETWYKSQTSKEQEFTGTLEAVPNTDGPSTLQRTSYYKLGSRTIYTAARKVVALDVLVGKKVVILGKPYDINLEGQAVSEIWPAAVQEAK